MPVLSQVTPVAEKAPEAGATPAAAAPAVASPTAARGKVVSVMFSAADGNGVPLKDVAKNQVLVFDSEKAAEVLDVQDASDRPLDLAIVLLTSKEFKDKFAQEQAAAIELVQKLIRPGKDRAFVVSALGQKPWQGSRLNWSMDPNALVQQIKGMDKDMGLPDAFSYEIQEAGANLSRMYLQPIPAPPQFTFFNVVFAMMQTDPRPVRKAVVMFRYPMRHAPGWSERSSQMSDQVHTQIINIAQGMGISFYTIGTDEQVAVADTARADISGNNVAIHMGSGDAAAQRSQDKEFWKFKKEMYDGGRANIERLANETGGRPYWTTKKNYADATAGIINDLNARAVVTFSPADVSDAKPARPLKVQVARAARVSAPRAFMLAEKKN
jgi:VWFA-related protein